MTSTAMMNPFDDGKSMIPAMATTVTQATESSRAVAEVQAALFIARTNPRDQNLQFSQTYQNGGIGIHPSELDYKSFKEEHGDKIYWSLFVKP